MRISRLGLVLGLVVAGFACGGDDDAATTTTEQVTTTSDVSTTSTEPTGPSTTASPSTTEPQTTEPTTTTTTTEPSAATTAPPSTTATTQPPATTEPQTSDVKVYFLQGERLAIEHRQVDGPAVLRGALTDVLAGPTAAELEAGVTTAIADGTSLLDLNLADGTATVDLSDDFESGGGSLMMRARIAQLVFTATQFDNVDEVVFWMEGAPIEFLGGEGIVLSEPQTRSSTDRSLTNGVLIDEPDAGDIVSSPFVVTGEGDVFEGDFPIVIRRDGVDVAGPFVVRAGAWGMWDDFETTIELDLAPGPIELVASDGLCEPPNCPPTEIVVPLTLD